MNCPCTHHWLIDDPIGQMSHARCKICGAEGDFENYSAKAKGTTISNINAAFWAPFAPRAYSPPAKLWQVDE